MVKRKHVPAAKDAVATLEHVLRQGLEALNAGRLQEAKSIYQLLAQDRPNHPDVLHGQARLAWIEHHRADAISLLQRASEAAPAFAPFQLLLGDWQRECGKIEKTLSAWRQALELGCPIGALVQRIETVNDIPDTHLAWVSAVKHRSNALACIRRGEWAEAVALYRAAFETADWSPTAQVFKEAGTAALNCRQLDLAHEWLLQAAKELPSDADVCLNLGNVAQYRKQLQEAEKYYQQTLELRPSMPEAHNNLGVIFKNSNRLTEAESHLRQALELRPTYSAAWNNLGLTLQLLGRLPEAEVALRRGIEIAPDDVDLTMNLGAILGQQGKRAEAEVYYEKASKLAPDNALVLCNLGVNAFEKKNHAFAKECYEKAIAADPTWLPARNNLAALYMDLNRHAQAIEVCKEILAIDPNFADALNNMGISYRQINRLGEAKEALERALELQPDHKEAMSNLAFVYQDLGFFGKALELYRTALNLNKTQKAAWDNYLFCANYHPTVTQAEHLAIYRSYDEAMGRVEDALNCSPRPMEGRKLRVAYVSGDLRRHPQQYFFMPFLDHHDRSRFEIWCYSNGVGEDEVTHEMIRKSDGWRRTSGMTSKEMAQQVADDQIDILVDLAGHTGGNRADVYPYRAAPVQLATLLGWNFGVGLSAMDALIGDPWTLPENMEQYCIEPLLRVPCNTYVCRMSHDLPILPDLPAKRRGYITFGTTTRTVRLNDRDLAVWADMLREIPGSHLQFNSRNFQDPASIDRMKNFFGSRGIEEDRLEFAFTSPIHRAFENIDIYLDTFPHNNGTTLIEALWYGLPVITKVDRPPFGCIGQSMLYHAGLSEWTALTDSDYIRIAAGLAADWEALEHRRRTQRDVIARTALFDEVASVRWFEEAYLAMYKRKLEGA